MNGDSWTPYIEWLHCKRGLSYLISLREDSLVGTKASNYLTAK